MNCQKFMQTSTNFQLLHVYYCVASVRMTCLNYEFLNKYVCTACNKYVINFAIYGVFQADFYYLHVIVINPKKLLPYYVWIFDIL